MQVWAASGRRCPATRAVSRSSWFAGSSCSTCRGWCRLRGSQAGHSAPSPRTQGPGAALGTPGVPQSLPEGEKPMETPTGRASGPRACVRGEVERDGDGEAQGLTPRGWGRGSGGTLDISPRGWGHCLPSSPVAAASGSRRAPLCLCPDSTKLCVSHHIPLSLGSCPRGGVSGGPEHRFPGVHIY